MSDVEIKLNNAEIQSLLQSELTGYFMGLAEEINASAGGMFEVNALNVSYARGGGSTVFSIGGKDVDEENADALQAALLGASI